MQITGRNSSPVADIILSSLLLVIFVASGTTHGARESLESAEAGGASKRQVSWLKWWSYDGISGPDFWSINKRWRLCSEGKRQSPIEVATSRLLYDPRLEPLKLSWIDDSSRATATNEPTSQGDVSVQLAATGGRGLELWFPEERGAASLQLEGGPLAYAYRLYKMELHLGGGASERDSAPSTSTQTFQTEAEMHAAEGTVSESLRSGRRSEHLIDGRDFEGELQLHFYNSLLLSGATEARRASEQWEGGADANMFAAVSVFLARGHDQPISRTPTSSKVPLESLFGKLSQLVAANEQTKEQNHRQQIVSSIPRPDPDAASLLLLNGTLDRALIESLISTRSEYVTYAGSMNRPPCSENVDWILLNRPLRLPLGLSQWPLNANPNLNSPETNVLPNANAGSHDPSSSGSLALSGLLLPWNQDNIRPLKPRHGRLLRTSINLLAPPTEAGSAPSIGDKANCTGTRQLASQAACSLKPTYFYQLTSKWAR